MPFFLSLFLLVAGELHAREAFLSATGLYESIPGKPLSDQSVHRDNRFYSPQYGLWTDGALKQRWIFLPPGLPIRTESSLPQTDINHWTFPVGTKLWKEFAFETDSGPRRVETRLMEKTGEGQWEFSTYAWNDAQTDAELVPPAGLANHFPLAPGVYHDLPSQSDCMTCHQRGGDPVLGFDALQLSVDRDPLSPTNSGGLDLGELERLGLLEVSAGFDPAPQIHADTNEGRSAMGYLHANCGHCHNPDGTAGWTGLWLRHDVTTMAQAQAPTVLTALNQLTQFFQIPGEPQTYRLRGGAPEQSAILHRMEATDFDRMPPLGSKLVDNSAVELLRGWILMLAP